jgi:hypothetical protein
MGAVSLIMPITGWSEAPTLLGIGGRAAAEARVAFAAGQTLAGEAASKGRELVAQQGERILTMNRHVMTGSRASRAAHDFVSAGLEVKDVAQAVAGDIGNLSELSPGLTRGAVKVGQQTIRYSANTLESGETTVNFWIDTATK